ncbi:hypothetical protein WA158_002258 [Blastocystis sp. Blastoise]
MSEEQIKQLQKTIFDALDGSTNTQNESLMWLQQFQSSPDTWELCMQCLEVTDPSLLKVVFGLLKMFQQKIKTQWFSASTQVKEKLFQYCMNILCLVGERKLDCPSLLLDGYKSIVSYMLIQVSDDEYKSYFDLFSNLLNSEYGVNIYISIYSLFPINSMTLFEDGSDSRLQGVTNRLLQMKGVLLDFLHSLCTQINMNNPGSRDLILALFDCINNWVHDSKFEIIGRSYVISIEQLSSLSLFPFLLNLFSLSPSSPLYDDVYIITAAKVISTLLEIHTPNNPAAFMTDIHGKITSQALFQIAQKYTEIFSTIKDMISNNNIEYIQAVSQPLTLMFKEHFHLFNLSPYINELSEIYLYILTNAELPASILYEYLYSLAELITYFTENVKIPTVFLSIPESLIPRLVFYCSENYLPSDDPEYIHVRNICQDISLSFSDGFVGCERMSTILISILFNSSTDLSSKEACLHLYKGVIDGIMTVMTDIFVESYEEDPNKPIKPINTCIDKDIITIVNNLDQLKGSEDLYTTTFKTLFIFTEWLKCRPDICLFLLNSLIQAVSQQLYINKTILFLKQYISDLGYIQTSQYEQLLSFLVPLQSTLLNEPYSTYISIMTLTASKVQASEEAITFYIQKLLELYMNPIITFINTPRNEMATQSPEVNSVLINILYLSAALKGIDNTNMVKNFIISIYPIIDSLYNSIQFESLSLYICSFYTSVISSIASTSIPMDINVSIYSRLMTILQHCEMTQDVYKIIYVYISNYGDTLDENALVTMYNAIIKKLDDCIEHQNIDISIFTIIFNTFYHICLHPACPPSFVSTLYPYIIKCLNDDMIEYYFQKNILKIISYILMKDKFQDPQLHFGHLFSLFERLFTLSLSPLPIKLRKLYISSLNGYLITCIPQLKKLSHKVISQLFRNPPSSSPLSTLPSVLRSCLSKVFSNSQLNSIKFKSIMDDLFLCINKEMLPDTFINKTLSQFEKK